eukprot:3692800-Pleurochrysis_carterae.AAC.1
MRATAPRAEGGGGGRGDTWRTGWQADRTAYSRFGTPEEKKQMNRLQNTSNHQTENSSLNEGQQ